MKSLSNDAVLERLGLHRPELRAWACYDVGHSAWMTTVATALFPLFFVKVASAGVAPELARTRLAFTSSFVVALVGLLGPVLGAVADRRGCKKLLLGAFLAIGATAAAALGLVVAGQWRLALALFAIGSVAFSASLAFYNALLPSIAAPAEVDRVSSAGYALGYLGGGLLLALNMAMLASPARFGLSDTSATVRLSFLSAAGWWVLFAMPLFRQVREPSPGAASAADGAVSGTLLDRLRSSFRELHANRDAALALLAFLVYNDGISTIVRMGTTFGDEIGIPTGQLLAALLMIQLVGVPCSFVFGALAGRIGARPAILVALAVYSAVALYGFTLRTISQFFVLGFLVATVQGGAQALSRSLFASLVPRERAGEMFGIFGAFERFGGVLGTLLFGTTLSLTGSARPAVVGLLAFFALGALLLTRVDVERGRREAMAWSKPRGSLNAAP